VNQAIELFKSEDNWNPIDHMNHFIQKAAEHVKKVFKINEKKKKYVVINKICEEINIDKKFVEQALEVLTDCEVKDNTKTNIRQKY